MTHHEAQSPPRNAARPTAPDATAGGSEVVGLLLAAGGGRRLGGRPKALLTHHGRPLVEHAVGVLRVGGCARIHVVLGAEAATVRARAELPGCVLVDNPEWAEGMGSSLRAGLESLTGTGADAVLVSLVDQPGIGPEAVARVLAARKPISPPEPSPNRAGHPPDPSPRRPGGALVAATYDGRRGHPVLLGSAHWAAVAETATGDRGARAYLRAHEEVITLVECGDVALPYDIDTEADLVHLE
ncbi:nucleotidyltransferase family protein [Streptomyces europaeiscabiei]|uniref:nucleotidyltransferase family protein n=1 Tax=Streptomyces europaeiscabiei TaxID=146819 RepID=UPI002E175A63